MSFILTQEKYYLKISDVPFKLKALNYKLNVLSEEIFETWFDVENPESMRIKKNNVDISTTKSPLLNFLLLCLLKI